jgi:hypothetical protein
MINHIVSFESFMNESELNESGFHAALAKAKDEGLEEFEFAGKTFKVKEGKLKENEDLNEAKDLKSEVISRLSDFFRVPAHTLQKFNFDGKDDIKALTKALNSTNDQGTKLYYDMAIKLSKEDLGIDEGENIEDLFEAGEVSPDQILAPADKKKLKTAFENVVTGIDKLTFKRDGTIEGRRGYFYRHGTTPQGVADNLKSVLAGQGIDIDIVDAYDDFKTWPKDSNFVVVFRIKK